jgi:hypothetical protein
MTLRFRKNRSTATTSQRAATRLHLRKACLFREASRAYERDYLDTAAALGPYSPAELTGFARRLDPGLEGRDFAEAGQRLDQMPDYARQ